MAGVRGREARWWRLKNNACHLACLPSMLTGCPPPYKSAAAAAAACCCMLLLLHKTHYQVRSSVCCLMGAPPSWHAPPWMCENTSQTLGDLPPSFQAPSICGLEKHGLSPKLLQMLFQGPRHGSHGLLADLVSSGGHAPVDGVSDALAAFLWHGGECSSCSGCHCDQQQRASIAQHASAHIYYFLLFY